MLYLKKITQIRKTWVDWGIYLENCIRFKLRCRIFTGLITICTWFVEDRTTYFFHHVECVCSIIFYWWPWLKCTQISYYGCFQDVMLSIMWEISLFHIVATLIEIIKCCLMLYIIMNVYAASPSLLDIWFIFPLKCKSGMMIHKSIRLSWKWNEVFMLSVLLKVLCLKFLMYSGLVVKLSFSRLCQYLHFTDHKKMFNFEKYKCFVKKDLHMYFLTK